MLYVVPRHSLNTPELSKRINVVVLDWDETISESDTMGILAKAAGEPAQWQVFVDAYTSDMKKHEETYGTRATLQDEYKFLGSLSSVEMDSVKRIESARYFTGVTRKHLQKVAQTVKIRAGFGAFCLRLESHVVREILSVNWSREFIEYGLKNVTDPAKWRISANKLEFDDNGVCTGDVSKNKQCGIRTAMDKLNHLTTRFAEAHANDGLLVYIGDSNTDLPCLLKADIGIIIGENAGLTETCKKYSIRVEPFESLDRSTVYVKEANRLFRVTVWDQVRF